jgi:hypothetical protein
VSRTSLKTPGGEDEEARRRGGGGFIKLHLSTWERELSKAENYI